MRVCAFPKRRIREKDPVQPGEVTHRMREARSLTGHNTRLHRVSYKQRYTMLEYSPWYVWNDAIVESALVLVVHGVREEEEGIYLQRRTGLLLCLRSGRRQRRSEVGNERR
jgi:hypothetical protein